MRIPPGRKGSEAKNGSAPWGRSAGLAVLALLWVAVWVLPGPRSLFWAAWRPWPVGESVGVDEKFLSAPGSRTILRAETSRYERLERLYPNRKEVQFWRAVRQPRPESLRALEKLMRLYPQDMGLLSYYLEFCAGNYFDLKFMKRLNSPGTPAGVSERVLWSGMEEQARRGLKIEPDNAYFGWNLAFALVQLGRVGKASQVVIESSTKPGYRDYRSAAVMANYEVRKLEGPVPPQWIYAMSEQLNSFSHQWPMDEARLVTASACMALAQQMRSRGDTKGAVKLALAVMRCGRQRRTKSTFFFGSRAGRRIEECAVFDWQKNWQVGGTPTLAQVPNLATLATTAGDNQGAAEVRAEMATRNRRGTIPPWVDWTGSQKVSVTALFLEKVMHRFFSALAVLAGLWLASALAVEFFRRQRVRTAGTRVDVWVVAGTAVGAFLILVLADQGHFIQGYGDLSDTLYEFLCERNFAEEWSVGTMATFVGASVLFAAVARGTLWLRKQDGHGLEKGHELDRMGVGGKSVNALVLRVPGLLARVTLWAAFTGVVLARSMVFAFTVNWPIQILEAFDYLSWCVLILSLWQLRFWMPLKKVPRLLPFVTLLVNQSVAAFLYGGLLVMAVSLLGFAPLAARYERNFERVLPAGERPALRAMLSSQ